jgi:hypothetical protein
LIPAALLAGALLLFISPGPMALYSKVKKLFQKRKD